MTTLHKGLTYPTWNPGRFHTLYFGRVGFPPTALRWDVDSWGGIIGAGAPIGGSDLLPSFDLSPTTPAYRKILFGILGSSFEIRIQFALNQRGNTDPDQQLIILNILQGGAPQCEFEFFSQPVPPPWTWNLTRDVDFTVDSDAVAFPNIHLSISPVHWFASPPPPASSPF